MENQTQIESITLKVLVQGRTVTGISLLRVNESGYPYLTFLQGNKAQNVYFGIKSSEKILANHAIGDNIINVIKDADIVKATNAAGETRYKISIPSIDSEYASNTEMMEAFGTVDAVFDVNGFNAQFAAKPENTQTTSTVNKPAVRKNQPTNAK